MKYTIRIEYDDESGMAAMDLDPPCSVGKVWMVLSNAFCSSIETHGGNVLEELLVITLNQARKAKAVRVS